MALWAVCGGHWHECGFKWTGPARRSSSSGLGQFGSLSVTIQYECVSSKFRRLTLHGSESMETQDKHPPKTLRLSNGWWRPIEQAQS
eukprot:359580-Rhodomonas_salina.2